MSVTLLAMAGEYCVTIRRKRLVPAGIGKNITKLIRTANPDTTKAALSESKDLLSVAITRVFDQTTNGHLGGFQTRSLVAETLQEQALRLLRKIEWANIIECIPMLT